MDRVLLLYYEKTMFEAGWAMIRPLTSGSHSNLVQELFIRFVRKEIGGWNRVVLISWRGGREIVELYACTCVWLSLDWSFILPGRLYIIMIDSFGNRRFALPKNNKSWYAPNINLCIKSNLCVRRETRQPMKGCRRSLTITTSAAF